MGKYPVRVTLYKLPLEYGCYCDTDGFDNDHKGKTVVQAESQSRVSVTLSHCLSKKISYVVINWLQTFKSEVCDVVMRHFLHEITHNESLYIAKIPIVMTFLYSK